MSEKSIVTEKEFAEELDVHPKTAERWRQQGVGPKYVKLNDRLVRYRRQDINAWLEARTRQSTTVA